MFEPILCIFNGILVRFDKNILENRRNGKDKTKLIKLHYGALVMQVNGFQFQVKVYIALDEGSDYYRIYGEKDGTTKEYHHDIAFDELGDVIDSMIETGGMTKEELMLISYSSQISFDTRTALFASLSIVT